MVFGDFNVVEPDEFRYTPSSSSYSAGDASRSNQFYRLLPTLIEIWQPMHTRREFSGNPPAMSKRARLDRCCVTCHPCALADIKPM
eukprot:4164627-Pyramimonas_sp.AAC.1